MPKPFTEQTVIDGFASFESGVNSGVAPLLLPPNQLAFGTNTTIRGSYATHRPPFNLQTLDFGSNPALEGAFTTGLWQGACYYKAEGILTDSLVCSIAGHLYELIPSGGVWNVTDISIPGDYNSATATQAWLWQAEKWIIVTDGTTKLPIYYTRGFTRRSIGNNTTMLTIADGGTDIAGTNDLLPGLGGLLYIQLSAAPSPAWIPGTSIVGVGIGEYQVVTMITPTLYELVRVSNVGPATPPNVVWPQSIYPEFPAGRMGAYGMGRVWMSLTDAKQFMAGDIVGGPSGTLANNYRDAVLHSSENSYLAGGGYFTTPGAVGDIRAMIFTSTLDVSMGQGPLLVLTPTRTFSCYAPTDRSIWATITNPILTEALISNGAEGYYSTVIANGDCLFRSVDGIRSLVIGRRDFETWGNTPISGEMDRVLSLDNESLLRYSSAIIFDNRLLMTANPTPLVNHGVFHNGLVALNFDPLSGIRGKAPSVYDGLWTGLNTLQLVVGRFGTIERAFSFTYNTQTEEIELYEILTTPKDVFSTVEWPTDIEIYDNEMVPIVWTGESPVIFKAQDFRQQEFLRLIDGEILVDNLVGNVQFVFYYKPDQYPCWIKWFEWFECAPKTADNSKPQFRPRMGLGEPSGLPCDEITNRPFREAYTYQIKWIIRGHCRLLGARFKAVMIPQPQFSKQQCLLPESLTVVT